MSATYELTVAPNGARKTKADHPILPMITLELVVCARDCQIAGAGAIHLHVRADGYAAKLDCLRLWTGRTIQSSVGYSSW